MKSKIFYLLILSCFLLFSFGCRTDNSNVAEKDKTGIFSDSHAKPKLSEIASPEIKKVLESAFNQTGITKNYDPNYAVIPYPNGDVPPETGVCSDVVIRAFRRAGVDLQKEVHEDMAENFGVYPKKWNLPKPDKNIDHRRVSNLQKFFERKGKSVEITNNGGDYKPGDVVSWDLNGKGMTHIGLVSNIFNETTGNYSIIHNIGSGAKMEDVLFNWTITGHYRYF